MVHVYFSDDAGGSAVASTSAPATPADGTKFAQCCSRARVDYNMADSCYVFKALCSPDNSLAAASVSNNMVKLYSCSLGGLSHVADIAAHQATVSDIQFPIPAQPQALYSCSRDGSVKGWDLRCRQQAEM